MGKTRIDERLYFNSIVYRRVQLGSIIQVQRIEGKLFEKKEQAEQHGVDLCKEWVDNQFRLKD